MTWLIAALSVVGGGIAGSGLTFLLNLRREQRRIRDAYRSPQRAAIASIVAAVNDLLLRAHELKIFIDNSAAQSELLTGTVVTLRSRYTDAEADVISGQANRAVVSIDEAFTIGKLTIVDGMSYEAMVIAYREFVKVQSSFVGLEAIPRTSDGLREAVLPFVALAVRLKVALGPLVDAGQVQLAPTQSAKDERQPKDVKAGLKSRYPDLR